MKNSEEMIKSLFERREGYIKEQKKKRKKMLVAVMSIAVCFTTIFVIGVPILLNDGGTDFVFVNKNTITGIKKENDTSTTNSENTSNTEKKADTKVTDNGKSAYHNETESSTSDKKSLDTGGMKISLFERTLKSSDTDSFGEDELRHVDVILNGYKLYTQLEKSDYNKYRIEKYLKKTDFGKKLGVITEIGGWTEALTTPCSQEPALAGCEVYAYKPINSEAVIIVKGNGCCSLFYFLDFSEEGHSYNEVYDIFNASSAKDIERIDYSVRKPEGALVETVKKGDITDEADVENFIKITKGLIPYTSKNAISATPDWLNDAYEEYKKDSKRIVYIEASIVLKNGLQIPFEYEPYLGTGYVQGHYFLSKNDNSVLKKMFQE